MPIDLVETLTQLVSVPSVNPMGSDSACPECGEGRLTDILQSVFDSLGLLWHRQPVHPGRENILARLNGNSPPQSEQRVLLLEAHQDTVPTAGMTIEPFVPVVRDGRLYGRGACDVKGGMAAMLTALARLADERPRGMPTIILACTVNEEYGFGGAKALAELLAGGSRFVPRKPEAAIVAEPTDLDVVVAHKGVVRWRCHTSGRAGHSSRPESGENAIYRMARVLIALESYHRNVLRQQGSHPLCGPATLSVGTIRGGTSVNIIPDRATIEIDRRLRPDEEPGAAWRDVLDYLARAPETAVGPPQFDPPSMEAPALPDRDNRLLAEQLAAVVREVAGACQLIGVPYATDAPFFSSLGIPTVVFGPGSIAQAHTAEEWISLDQLQKAAEVYYRLIVEYSSRSLKES